jgi:hypothetical protein
MTSLTSFSSLHTDPPISSPMPHVSCGTAFDVSGVLASRLLDFLFIKRPSAQGRLDDRRLDEARGLSQKNGDRVSSSDLKIARYKVLQCVLSPTAYPNYVLTLSVRQKSRQGWDRKVAFRNPFKRRYTESRPKRHPVSSRSLVCIT